MKTTKTVSKISNTKCLIQCIGQSHPFYNSNTVTQWPIFKYWSEKFFAKKAGSMLMPCKTISETDMGEQKVEVQNRTVSEFISLLENNKSQRRKHCLMRHNIDDKLRQSLNLYSPLSIIPNHIECSQDLWISYKDQFTPLHFDTANNLIVCLAGSKEFYLYPPSNSKYLYQNDLWSGGRFNFSQARSLRSSCDDYPLADCSFPYRITLHPGELLYIPEGWWHEVTTLEDKTATITHFFYQSDSRSFLYKILRIQAINKFKNASEQRLIQLLYNSSFDNYEKSVNNLLKQCYRPYAIMLYLLVIETSLNKILGQHHQPIESLIRRNTKNQYCKDIYSSTYWKEISSLSKNECLDLNSKDNDLMIFSFLQEIINDIRLSQ